MSERKFELYLSLLSRFLRLNPNQREEIADELRDHLAERLEELTAEGLSREDAIHRALSEFGDAADLAAHFTHIANRRKRRLIMRCTLGTVVATAACILFATAFWPQNPAVNLPTKLVAQDAASPKNVEKQPTKTAQYFQQEQDARRAKVEAMLEGQTEFDLVDMPLGDVFDHISDAHNVAIVIDKQFFVNYGIKRDTKINLSLSSISLRTALELMFEQAGTKEVGIAVRDGFIYLTEKGSDLQIEVYNCRYMLAKAEGKLIHPIYGAVEPVGKSGGLGAPTGVRVGVGGSQSAIVHIYRQSPGEALIAVMTSTVQPESWEIKVGDGSIEEFNGLLVARASQDVHREIKNLLEMMREAAKENNGRKKAAPTAGAGAGDGDGAAGAGGKGLF